MMMLMHALVDGGNTVIVVEHDMDVVAAADWVIDLGPGAGSLGGRLSRQEILKKCRKPQAAGRHHTWLRSSKPCGEPRTINSYRIHSRYISTISLLNFGIPLIRS